MQQAGLLGCMDAGGTDSCAGAREVSRLNPADRVSLEPWRLLWLREGDRLHWLVTQPGVRGRPRC